MGLGAFSALAKVGRRKENSEIRNWLNTEFFDQSFTQEEKSAILPVSYESIKYGWGEKDQSEEQYTTEDRVVLLSRKDVEKMPLYISLLTISIPSGLYMFFNSFISTFHLECSVGIEPT